MLLSITRLLLRILKEPINIHFGLFSRRSFAGLFGRGFAVFGLR